MSVPNIFKKKSAVQRFWVGVENSGNLVAHDVKLVATIKDPPIGLIVKHEKELPDEPQEQMLSLVHLQQSGTLRPRDISVRPQKSGFEVVASLGKIQSKDTAITNEILCIGADRSISFEVSVKIYADNLECPTEDSFFVNVSATQKYCEVRDFTAGALA